ncbi:ATP-binding protein [Pseudoduganella namucuonensis]|uniref:histidine kinase n=1 Tax=Pseudoduganella namucuonensis TaxID=1035707 RepID=A0A1I7K8A7_9BURK|nr:ATP-binding protein [Pseudoduganella namucuonensis]SFU93693.1 PAS domain S-box-containing protein [Pseudoduganella namucuonensis]
MAPPLQQTILIVTGAVYDQAALEETLAAHGFRAQMVNRGDKALAAVHGGGVSLVLLDVALAGSADFELCRHLGAAAGRKLPILMMSPSPNDDEHKRALAAGATGYGRLPYSVGDLVDQVLVELTVHHAWPARPGAPAFDTRGFEVNYHDMMTGTPDAVMLFDAEHGLPIAVNRGAEALLGRENAQLSQMRLVDLCPPEQPDGRPSSLAVRDLIRKVLAGEIRVFSLSFAHSGGRRIDCELRLVMLNKDGHRLYHMRMVDVTGHKLAEALRAGQNKLLEMVARGAPLRQTLDTLMLLVEGQSTGVLCSTLLLDLDGRTMRAGAAPSLPADFMAAIDGLEIGPAVGSCGTAMFRGQAVVVHDIQADPLWAPYAATAARHGLRACWSMPILLDEDKVLGSFAMYYREPRSPGAEELRLIDVATHLAGIAIARTRHEDELIRHRAHLEELVAARTAELRHAKEQAEMASEELSTALENLSMTQDELVRRDKLAALGALVAGVAHELNTPIGNSLMVASTMAERTRAIKAVMEGGLRRSALESYLRQSAEADDILARNLGRAASLVQSFKSIAVDTDQAQRRRFALGNFISELVLPLHAAVKHLPVEVALDIPEALEMDSYPAPLGRVIHALFENSLVHGFEGRAGGRIAIRARATDKDEIALSYTDDGAGIPAEHLGRIYDPFFTTKLGAGGSGLGLHVAHNIVLGVLGGRIGVESVPGKGVAFTMLLPAVAPL